MSRCNINHILCCKSWKNVLSQTSIKLINFYMQAYVTENLEQCVLFILDLDSPEWLLTISNVKTLATRSLNIKSLQEKLTNVEHFVLYILDYFIDLPTLELTKLKKLFWSTFEVVSSIHNYGCELITFIIQRRNYRKTQILFLTQDQVLPLSLAPPIWLRHLSIEV